MSTAALTLLINHSISLHDHYMDDAGTAADALPVVTGSVYHTLQATYDIHNNYAEMLRGIRTEGRSAAQITAALREVQDEAKQILASRQDDDSPWGAAERTLAQSFITELGLIITNGLAGSPDEPEIDENAAEDALATEDSLYDSGDDQTMIDAKIAARGILREAVPMAQQYWVSRVADSIATATVQIARK